MKIDIGAAIISLRPNAEWVMRDNDINSIEWHTDGVEPLTQAEVEAEMARLEQAAAEEAARKEAARASAVAKLAALGLDADEVAAILGGTA